MEAATYIKLLETQLREFITRCDELVEIVERQAAEITALKAKIVELEARLNKNSSNSHKPPSLDGFKAIGVYELRRAGLLEVSLDMPEKHWSK